MEICHAFGYRKHFATNIKCENYFIQNITNYPDLESWLKKKHGKKMYILDESGKHIAKMGFMSTQNRQFMDMLQMIRHYDCGFVGIAPSEKRIDSGFLNTDILDANIKKISRTTAKVTDYLNVDCYFLNDLPKTSILHSSKDMATFTMKKQVNVEAMGDCCKAAYWYAKCKKFALVGKYFNPPLSTEQVKRLVLKHLEHAGTSETPIENEGDTPKSPAGQK
jgi:hypothetical protein